MAAPLKGDTTVKTMFAIWASAAALVIAAPIGNAHAEEGYHRATGFEQVKAACELMADGAGAGSFAFGNAGFMLGVGIRRSIDHARAYDNCMVLKGYARN
jgi:hypothetical protein